MASFNKVILMGHLTREPEKRVAPSGTVITKFGLAMNRRWKDSEGNTLEETTFVDVDAFGRQAELIAEMAKGDPIHLEGRLRLEQWEDKETQAKRSRLVVVCESFQFLKSKDGE